MPTPLKEAPRLSAHLGGPKWEPTVPLEEGLVKTTDYFRTKVR